MAKVFVLTMLAVFAGIMIYANVVKKKNPAAGNMIEGPTGTPLFFGPDIDPVTGAYVAAGVKSGTVEFPAQGN